MTDFYSSKHPAELRDFANTSIVGSESPEISDVICQPPGANWSHLLLLVEVGAGVLNTDFTFSLAVIDRNDVQAWLPQQIVPVRALPNGDKVVDLIFCETLHAPKFRIALETAPLGGPITIKYAFGAV